jgi:hypothetical protein
MIFPTIIIKLIFNIFNQNQSSSNHFSQTFHTTITSRNMLTYNSSSKLQYKQVPKTHFYPKPKWVKRVWVWSLRQTPLSLIHSKLYYLNLLPQELESLVLPLQSSTSSFCLFLLLFLLKLFLSSKPPFFLSFFVFVYQD